MTSAGSLPGHRHAAGAFPPQLSRRPSRISSRPGILGAMADEVTPAAIALLYGRGTLPVAPPRNCVPTVIEKRAMPRSVVASLRRTG